MKCFSSHTEMGDENITISLAKKRIIVFAILALFLIMVFSVPYEVPIILANAQESIKASASAGGTINPSGLTSVSQGSSKQFTIKANGNRNISSISIDGSKVYLANYTFAQEPPVNTGDRNEKVVMINNQRFILANAYTYSNYTATINVYTADANWNPVSLVSMSPPGDTAKDFYVMNFSSSFPDTILICGTTSYYEPEGFIARYNVTSDAWQWALQPNSGYLTNILNPAGNTFFIQTASNVQCFYETDTTNLFNPSSWTSINEPSATWEGRIAYFNGEIYCLQCSSGLSWALNVFNLTSLTWSVTPLMSVNDTSGWPLSDIFPYVWSDSTEILFTAPIFNATGNEWNIYYSTTGATFNLVASLPAVGDFQFINDQEFHCWANDIGNGLIAVLDENDNNPSSFIAVMTLQGTVINEGAGYLAHDTGVRFIIDGNLLVTGAEDCALDMTHQAGVKVVTVLTMLKSYTYTFSNVQSSHTIAASFSSSAPTNSISALISLFIVIAVIFAIVIGIIALFRARASKRAFRHDINQASVPTWHYRFLASIHRLPD